MFSKQEIIEASAAFVPAADETWRLQHDDDAVAQLFRTMVDPAHPEPGGGEHPRSLHVTHSGRAPAARVAPAFIDVDDAVWIRRPDDR